MDKILVVRNDKIGDFILALPSFAMLKKSIPDAQVDALVPSYTLELAKLSPWIDSTIVDKSKKEEQPLLISDISMENYTHYICLFSTTRNAQLGRKASIPYRLAPATKLAQFLFTDRLKQRRSKSEKPEFEYNLDLVRHFLLKKGITPIEPSPPYMIFDPDTKSKIRNSLLDNFSSEIEKLCFIHAGSGGSANNLSLSQYAKLIEKLNQIYPKLGFVLTSGPGEEEKAAELQALLGSSIQSFLYHSTKGLTAFCQTISCADLFIAGSTGPLHIAGACDVLTVGFFPSKRSATPLRWKTLNSEGRHIAFTPSKDDHSQENMESIDIKLLMDDLSKFLHGNKL